MCLATVYVEEDGQREEVMQEVAWIKPADGEVQLTTLLGQSKRLQAHIESIDLMNSLVVLSRGPIVPDTAPGDQEGESS